MEREACVCDHGYERSDLCAEIIIIIIIHKIKLHQFLGLRSGCRRRDYFSARGEPTPVQLRLQVDPHRSVEVGGDGEEVGNVLICKGHTTAVRKNLMQQNLLSSFARAIFFRSRRIISRQTVPWVGEPFQSLLSSLG